MHMVRDINSRHWQQCMGYHRLIFVYCGFWPFATDEENQYILCFAKYIPHLAIVGTTLSFIVLIYDMTWKLDNYMLLAESLSYMLTLWKAMLVIMIAILKMDDIVGVYADLESFTHEVLDEKEREIFQRCGKKTNWFTIINIIVWCGYSIVVNIQPMFEAERRYAINLNLPLTSPFFEMWYLAVVLAGLGSIFIVAVADSTMISIFMYITCYLKILQYKLKHGQEIALNCVFKKAAMSKPSEIEDIFSIENIQEGIPNITISMISKSELHNLDVPDDSSGPLDRCVQFPRIETQHQHDSSISFNTGINAEMSVIDIDLSDEEEETTSENLDEIKPDADDLEAEANRHLVYCVNLHKDLIRVTSITLDKINYMLFLLLIVGGVAVCLAMFLITVAPFGSFGMFLFSAYLSLILEELYGYCWASREMQEESVRVSDALYFSDWTDASPSYKRSMLMVMTRAVRPVQISTMAFLTFDMEMFRKVVNTGYSYFNVMSTMHTDK